MPQDTGSATAMPQIVIDRAGTPDRRIMTVDSFGQRVQMSIDQFRKLAAEGVSERFVKIASLCTAKSLAETSGVVVIIRSFQYAAQDGVTEAKTARRA